MGFKKEKVQKQKPCDDISKVSSGHKKDILPFIVLFFFILFVFTISSIFETKNNKTTLAHTEIDSEKSNSAEQNVQTNQNPAQSQKFSKFCTDSDGGLDYFAKGYISAISESGAGIRGSDSCVGDEVAEWYCLPDLSYNQSRFLCPSGCESGECISATSSKNQQGDEAIITELMSKLIINQRYLASSCTDSDGGINPAEKGNTPMKGENISGNFNDYCLSQNILFEGFCGDTNTEYKYIHCKKGCNDGVCVGGEGDIMEYDRFLCTDIYSNQRLKRQIFCKGYDVEGCPEGYFGSGALCSTLDEEKASTGEKDTCNGDNLLTYPCPVFH